LSFSLSRPLPVKFFQKKKWKKRKQTNNAVNAQHPKGNGIIGGDPFTGRKPFMPSLLVGHHGVADCITLAAFLSISYEKLLITLSIPRLGLQLEIDTLIEIRNLGEAYHRKF
jgi:hypothetical protein